VNRNQRALLAQETLAILEAGRYTAADGSTVDMGEAIERCIETTVLYTPEASAELKASLPDYKAQNTTIEVRNESTLSAAKRLAETGRFSRVCCLNFASAKNPGGGFLGGSQAQEESLALSSALYASLLKQTQYYDYNRHNRSSLYSDYMIYSPDVPVFRNDEGGLIAPPYLVSFITSPAVNAGAVKLNEPQNVNEIHPTLVRRAEYILAAAAHQQCDALVLGAWGCGVFKNDVHDIANIWYHYLNNSENYNKRFKQITFAVLDRNDRGPYQIFYNQFHAQNH
jgi:uncharacterized protein (TIGR02452 family)